MTEYRSRSMAGIAQPVQLSDAQLMWVETIHGIINQRRFDLGIGDMNYVLGNAIAKMVSSSAYYRITRNAESYLSQTGVDFSEPLHIRKHVYGKLRKTLVEHTVPASVLKRLITGSDRTLDRVYSVASLAGVPTIVLREEDKLLTTAGLGRKMPEAWKLGDSPYLRYAAARIELSEREVTWRGPIVR